MLTLIASMFQSVITEPSTLVVHEILTVESSESVMAFPDYEALTARMEQAGLVETRFYPFTFGIATLYVGVKA